LSLGRGGYKRRFHSPIEERFNASSFPCRGRKKDFPARFFRKRKRKEEEGKANSDSNLINGEGRDF